MVDLFPDSALLAGVLTLQGLLVTQLSGSLSSTLGFPASLDGFITPVFLGTLTAFAGLSVSVVFTFILFSASSSFSILFAHRFTSSGVLSREILASLEADLELLLKLLLFTGVW